jgi:hypothetical protein
MQWDERLAIGCLLPTMVSQISEMLSLIADLDSLLSPLGNFMPTLGRVCEIAVTIWMSRSKFPKFPCIFPVSEKIGEETGWSQTESTTTFS